jgi:hypothetical protein
MQVVPGLQGTKKEERRIDTLVISNVQPVLYFTRAGSKEVLALDLLKPSTTALQKLDPGRKAVSVIAVHPTKPEIVRRHILANSSSCVFACM